jgi:hypothetical protein
MAKKTNFQKGFDKAKEFFRPKKTNGKRHTPGLAGRAGGFLIGVVPVVAPAPGVIKDSQNRIAREYSAGTVVQMGFFEYVNGLVHGIGFEGPFNEVEVYNKDGKLIGKQNPSNAGVPRGSTWALALTGTVYLVFDKIANMLNDGRGMNIPGTKMRMIRS